jgi:hypothetical protein
MSSAPSGLQIDQNAAEPVRIRRNFQKMKTLIDQGYFNGIRVIPAGQAFTQTLGNVVYREDIDVFEAIPYQNGAMQQTAVLGLTLSAGAGRPPITNTTANTSFGTGLMFVGGYLGFVNRTIRMSAYLSITATIGATLSLRYQLGSNVTNQLLNLPVSGMSGTTLVLNCLMSTALGGTSGQINGSSLTLGSILNSSIVYLTPIDLTKTWAFDLWAQWSTASPANSVTLNSFFVEAVL